MHVIMLFFRREFLGLAGPHDQIKRMLW